MMYMYLRSIFFVSLICLLSSGLAAQTTSPTKNKRLKWALYAGVGPNYYFNNLKVGKDLVKPFNYSFVARFMWEPEHFLSLGIETGYNRLYTLKASNSSGQNAHIINSAVPIQIVVSMKFLNDYYFNFSMGQSILFNKATATNGNFDATSFSFADLGAALGYRRAISERFVLSAEAKFYYSTHLDDKNIALIFMAGYRF